MSSGGASGAGGSGAECSAACTPGAATSCDGGKQTVCVETAPGCSEERSLDCVCFAGRNCLQLVHREWGGTDNSGASGVAFDSAGNAYVSASTAGRLPATGLDLGHQGVLTKWSPTLELLWVRQLPLEESVIARAVATDGEDNVYLAGAGGPTPGFNGMDLLLSKVAPDGSELWSRAIGSSLNDDASAVTTDGAGNVYLGGFSSAALDVDPALGGIDATLTKWTAAGERQWSRQFGSTGSDAVRGLAVDAAGNVYAAGAVGGPFADAHQGESDIFVAKYSGAGEQLWARQLGGPLADGATDVAFAADTLYVVGITLNQLEQESTVVVDDSDLVLLRFDPTGTLISLKQWHTPDEERFPQVAVGAGGRLYLTGGTTGDFDADWLSGARGETDIFLAEWNADGVPLWVHFWGSDSWDGALGIDVHESGRIAIAADVQAALPGFEIQGTGDAVVTTVTLSSAP